MCTYPSLASARGSAESILYTYVNYYNNISLSIYIYIHISLSLSLYIYIYIYIVHICMMHIYTT